MDRRRKPQNRSQCSSAPSCSKLRGLKIGRSKPDRPAAPLLQNCVATFFENLRTFVEKHVTFLQKTLHLANPDSGFQSAPETAQDRKRAEPSALWEL